MLLMHCDDTAYVGTPDTNLYKLVDAICGTCGAGGLVNEVFVARLAGAMETIFGTDLDYVFGNTSILVRAPEESYPYNPSRDTLTAAQWNEVRVKDAWYRARIRDFFTACGLGSTVEGVRMCVQAALSVDCDTYEVWRYMDNFGITYDMGRSPNSARNELVIQPHKDSMGPEEMRLVRDMLSRFMSIDTIVTVNVHGLAVHIPVPATGAAADSTYFEVQKVVTPTPIMSQLPPPDLLPIDLLPTETWMYSGDPTLAPYAQFNISQEYAYYYLVGGGSRSPIDSVTYGTINPYGPVKVTVFELSGAFNLVSNVAIGMPTDSWYSQNLNADYFQWIPVPYQADLYPMSQSVAQATANLTNAINSIPGPFILVGYDQGATAISNVYDQIRTGSLQSRRPDLLAGLAFGNPRRQPEVTFPMCPDPGGHGIQAWELLQDCEPLWWEFAAPGDLICTSQDTIPGANDQTVMGAIYNTFTGILSSIAPQFTNVIANAEIIIQNLLDAFYGLADPALIPAANAHAQYQNPAFHPVPGDARDCIQIGADYISSLAIPNLAALAPPAVTTQVVCYEVTDYLANPPTSWFADALDSRIRYVSVPWPMLAELPLQEGIDTAIANLIIMINRNVGPFLLIGRGIGAIVTSTVYDMLRTGTMQHRRVDLLAAASFGSPRREAGVIFPQGTDPGGHGISANRLSGTEPLWWEFANPDDLLCTHGDTTNDLWAATMFDATVSSYAGDPSVITVQFPTAPINVAQVEADILATTFYASTEDPHATYDTATQITGDPRSAYQIARDYLNTFASRSIPYMVPAPDPMRTYRPAQNFESFTSVSNYGPWYTYDIVDSPDNFPGGKFGKTPTTAPAINPDGTPYVFPWPSEQAYIAAKITQVQDMGGQADQFHFRLPMGQSAITKEVFTPDLAIAYTAPTQESTVSRSLTRGRPLISTSTGWVAGTFTTSSGAPAGASTSS